ncbi:MAG: iron-containing alcohol dehydrogenase [Sutterella sp.]|nr:iron-containing alcohol dehydrogenase [Sutterella sp.]MDD7428053.1 iron-containing alcohol dehydrogenase [Sutterella sp.]MDY3273563.1 iron-containing alcohol dehydrogenase [Duodenibacillus sp.]
MEFFTYRNPTELMFGRGAQMKAPKAFVDGYGAKKALLVYGRGSAVKSGLIDAVKAASSEAGLTLVEKGGVQPNPTIEFVREALELARSEGIDSVLAVGGGSVIDTAKTVAAAFSYEGDPWDFFSGKAQVSQVLPLAAILTIPAAGSEQSKRAVITNGDKKLGMGNDCLRPKLAAINPELFFTLPANQAAAGIFDMMSHIMERYFTKTPDVEFTSTEAEGALRVIMENALKIKENPKSYAAWAEVALAGTFAHCGFFGLGHEEDWACHGMEHALSGWVDTITHGAGLAILTPAWMRYVWSEDPERFVRFAERVMGVTPMATDEATIKLGIAKLFAFIQQMGLPTAIHEVTSEKPDFDHLADLSFGKGHLGGFKKLTHEDAVNIFQSVI